MKSKKKITDEKSISELNPWPNYIQVSIYFIYILKCLFRNLNSL